MAALPLETLFTEAFHENFFDADHIVTTLDKPMHVVGFMNSMLNAVDAHRKEIDKLQENPSPEFEASCFPYNPRQMARGLGLYRPVLKSDQGPGGNFAKFEIGGNKLEKSRITEERGLSIPENYFRENITDDFACETALHYAAGNLEKTREMLEKTAMKGETERRQVGRLPFFFCRPVKLHPGARIPEELARKIEIETDSILCNLESRSEGAGQSYERSRRSGMAFKMSVEKALESGEEAKARKPRIIYAQPDVVIRKDGSFFAEKINVPDLCMFQTQVDSYGNEIFDDIRNLVSRLGEEVAAVLDRFYARGDINIVVDLETKNGTGDTLEIKETHAMKRLLESYRSVKIITPQELTGNERNILLLNADVRRSEYEKLFDMCYLGDASCYPDPFARILSEEPTLPNRRLSGMSDIFGNSETDGFIESIKPPKEISNVSITEYMLRVMSYMLSRGIRNPIQYIKTSNERSPIAITMNYHGISKLYSRLKNQQPAPESITLYGIPFRPQHSVIDDANGSRYYAFRFMATRSGRR